MAPKWLSTRYGRDDDAQRCVALAHDLLAQGKAHAAASAYDRAYCLAPGDPTIAAARRAVAGQSDR